MSNPQLAQVFDSVNQLLKQPAALLLREMVLGRDVVEELTVAAVLHDQKQALGRLDDFVQLNDAGVPHDLQDVDFSLDSLDVVDVLDLPFVQNLDRHFLPGENVKTLLHFSEGALAECLFDLIVSNHLDSALDLQLLR